MTALPHYLAQHWPDLASLAGVIIAIWQIWRVKNATEAEREAIQTTVRRVERSFAQYAVTTAKRQLREAMVSVDNGDWKSAQLRCADLAEQAVQLGQAIHAEASQWLRLAQECRDWEAAWRKMLLPNAGQPAKTRQSKWIVFAGALSARLDQHDRALGTSQEQNHDD